MRSVFEIPAQDGRVAVVTGASAGLGLATARLLAGRGAVVVLACREPARVPPIAGQVELLRLDLASLASIRRAADELRARHARIDLLINNAGVLSFTRQQTDDGFELQFGTNHLGHFAFTGLVLDRLFAAAGSRVVTVSSVGHAQGRMRFDDLQGEQRFAALAAYNQSKLANLLFTLELQRRLAAVGAPTIALAAHPGGARDTRIDRGAPLWFRVAGWLAGRLFGNDAATSALASVRAATDPAARGGEYYGPGGWFGLGGPPVRVQPSPRALDVEAQRRLWLASEQVTKVTYEALRA
ncbi:oxidoreductase [Nannocystis sp. SCPEA4]|uniref:oxidoreductase n=1 Tax=Nannocystis sp. SCPEA4 TaxID=2996787 RepID=UPI00226FF251|nr:oxidoreductase [Nannocystis sp. SCPEA4]